MYWVVKVWVGGERVSSSSSVEEWGRWEWGELKEEDVCIYKGMWGG